MQQTNIQCGKCGDRGFFYVMDGGEDVDKEYCFCAQGQQEEMFDGQEFMDAVELAIAEGTNLADLPF